MKIIINLFNKSKQIADLKKEVDFQKKITEVFKRAEQNTKQYINKLNTYIETLETKIDNNGYSNAVGKKDSSIPTRLKSYK